MLGYMEQRSFLPYLRTISLRVSDLTLYLRQVLESDLLLQDVWVQGEISNLSRPSSGHIYFTLKDEGASLRCVIWRSTAQRLRGNLQNGMAVEAHGRISIYERDGQYQLYVDSMRLTGEGWLYQEFLRLKARLEQEGLFDPERKRPLPPHPKVVGIVTSPTGAALQDMLNILRDRYPLCEVIVAPAQVQGDNAPLTITAALRAVCRQNPDVVILARGGGSLEDLWAFNDERVVRAIAECPIPVVTGIGHETDFTLSDFAADLRAPTPTGAAVAVSPDRDDLRRELSGTIDALAAAFGSRLDQLTGDLDEATYRLDHLSPLRRVENDRQRLDDLVERAKRAQKHILALRQARSQALAGRWAALNPLAVLQRGYAVVTDTAGRVLHSSAGLQAGQDVHVRLAEGAFDAQVTAAHPDQPHP